MNKNTLLSGSDKNLLDTIMGEIKKHQEDHLRDNVSIKKVVLVQFESNPATANWKFIKQYHALKYLNLV